MSEKTVWLTLEEAVQVKNSLMSATACYQALSWTGAAKSLPGYEWCFSSHRAARRIMEDAVPFPDCKDGDAWDAYMAANIKSMDYSLDGKSEAGREAGKRLADRGIGILMGVALTLVFSFLWR